MRSCSEKCIVNSTNHGSKLSFFVQILVQTETERTIVLLLIFFPREGTSLLDLNRLKPSYFLGPHLKFESAVVSLS